jgi:hypothetical protein
MNNAGLLSNVESVTELSEEQLDNCNGGLSKEQIKVIENQGGTVTERFVKYRDGTQKHIVTVTMNGETQKYVNGQLQT